MEEKDRKESQRVHNGKAWVERRRTTKDAVGRRWGERVKTRKTGAKEKDKKVQGKKGTQAKKK